MSIAWTPIDWKHYDACHADGMSDTVYAESIGLSQPAFSHRKKKRHLEDSTPPANETPTTTLQRLEFAGEPVSAEPVQTWDDPEDAKPECWNLWLPHGLKRRLEAQAKTAGIAPSQLVQRLLMAALNGEGANHG